MQVDDRDDSIDQISPDELLSLRSLKLLDKLSIRPGERCSDNLTARRVIDSTFDLSVSAWLKMSKPRLDVVFDRCSTLGLSSISAHCPELINGACGLHILINNPASMFPNLEYLSLGAPEIQDVPGGCLGGRLQN